MAKFCSRSCWMPPYSHCVASLDYSCNDKSSFDSIKYYVPTVLCDKAHTILFWEPRSLNHSVLKNKNKWSWNVNSFLEGENIIFYTLLWIKGCEEKFKNKLSVKSKSNICSKRIGAPWLFSSARLSFSLFWK